MYALKSAQDALTIKQHLMAYHPKTAVIVGSGFIGLEMLEGLISAGLSVTLVEKNQQLSIGPCSFGHGGSSECDLSKKSRH